MPNSEHISAKFYDQLGAEGLIARTDPGWDEQIIGRLRAMLKPVERILDVGCGYGRIAIPLASRGNDVTGLDVSRALLHSAGERAEQQGASVRFVHASMCRMPLSENSFDVVICLWSAFHELLDYEEQVLALTEMYRVLLPGGWCLIEGPLYRAATAEEVFSGKRFGPDNRVSDDTVNGLANPHFHHDFATFERLMAQCAISVFAVFVEDWAGRPRQFLRFEKSPLHT
jgi:ubiquinone/menaquinone biosynthesis C-methylase UbiE